MQWEGGFGVIQNQCLSYSHPHITPTSACYWWFASPSPCPSLASHPWLLHGLVQQALNYFSHPLLHYQPILHCLCSLGWSPSHWVPLCQPLSVRHTSSSGHQHHQSLWWLEETSFSFLRASVCAFLLLYIPLVSHNHCSLEVVIFCSSHRPQLSDYSSQKPSLKSCQDHVSLFVLLAQYTSFVAHRSCNFTFISLLSVFNQCWKNH